MRIPALIFSIVAALSLVASGCSKEGGSSARPDQQALSTSSTGHAAAGVKPGSHEDWCEEHQVPESQCSRCNPSLTAAFKATGDWCAEHGLPESQCLKCNPDTKIVRPPKGK